MIHLSNSETCTLCKRVFSAMGFPAGSDVELANAVAWLAAIRIVPLSELAESMPPLQEFMEIANEDRMMGPTRVRAPNLEYVNPLTLMEGFDRLTAYTVKHQCSDTATMLNSRYTELLVPLALARTHLPVRFEISLTKLKFAVQDGEIWISSDMESTKRWQESKNVKVSCAPHSSSSVQHSFARKRRGQHLTRSKLEALSSRRVEIDEQSFRILKQKAAESFVPNSELSRRSGAGAEVDDSD